jgi:preprotein translocase subunit SecF
MEIFKNTNFDFLGKKWIFIGLSLVLTAAGLVSLVVKGGPRYGIDFKGGALMYVKFKNQPPEDQIRKALSAQIAGEISIQRITGSNEVIVETEIANEQALNENRQKMAETLERTFGEPASGKRNFHGLGAEAVALTMAPGLQRAGVAMNEEQLMNLAKALTAFRDGNPNFGLINSFDQVSGVAGVTPAVINVLKEQFYLAPFAIRNVEVVGPKVGSDLRADALKATLLALLGMLVYIAFRFEFIYGVAAVIAVFHDTIMTVGLFSIFHKEISLTVVAALLTLVGYSMNDTIVVFDRIRENLRLNRKESFANLVNLSINQTLSRTIMVSGLTFLTAASLWLFGGQVLNGFSFALVVGIIVGTYSSIFIASPILIFWRDYAEGRKKVAMGGGAVAKEAPAKSAAKEAAKAPSTDGGAKKLAGGRAK